MLVVLVAYGQWKPMNGMDDMTGFVSRSVCGAISDIEHNTLLSGSWLAIAVQLYCSNEHAQMVALMNCKDGSFRLCW